MKLPPFLVAYVLAAATASASDAPQFEVTARYQGYRPAVLTPSPPDARPEPSGNDLLTAPRVTTQAGQRATVEITREVPVPGGTEDGKPTVSSGVTLDVTPTLKDGKIVLTGRSIVRQRLDPAGKQPLEAISFNTRETFFSGEVTDGKSLTIQTGDDVKDASRVTLTVTRVAPPKSSHVSHVNPPKYRVYAIDPSPKEAGKPIYKTLGVIPAETANSGAKIADDRLREDGLALMGIFQPAEQSSAVLLQMKESLRELPAAEQPITISSTLGQDGQTLDVKVQPADQSTHAVPVKYSIEWGSDVYLALADPTRASGRRGLLVRQE